MTEPEPHDVGGLQRQTASHRKKRHVHETINGEGWGDELMDLARELVMQDILRMLNEGATALQAIDLYGTEVLGYKDSEWARMRDAPQSSVHLAKKRGRKSIAEGWLEESH